MKFFRSPPQGIEYSENKITDTIKKPLFTISELNACIIKNPLALNQLQRVLSYTDTFESVKPVGDTNEMRVLSSGEIYPQSLFATLLRDSNGKIPLSRHDIARFPDDSVSTLAIIDSYRIAQTPLEFACLLGNKKAIEVLLHYRPDIGSAPYNLLSSPSPELVTNFFPEYQISPDVYLDQLLCNFRLFELSLQQAPSAPGSMRTIRSDDQIVINRIKVLCEHQPDDFYFWPVVHLTLSYFQNKRLFSLAFMSGVTHLVHHCHEALLKSERLTSIKQMLTLYINMMITHVPPLAIESSTTADIANHQSLFEVTGKIASSLGLTGHIEKTVYATLDRLHKQALDAQPETVQANYQAGIDIVNSLKAAASTPFPIDVRDTSQLANRRA